MTFNAFKTTGQPSVCSPICLDLQQQQQKKTSKVRVIVHWWPVDSPQKGTVKQKMFPMDDVIMIYHIH